MASYPLQKLEIQAEATSIYSTCLYLLYGSNHYKFC